MLQAGGAMLLTTTHAAVVSYNDSLTSLDVQLPPRTSAEAVSLSLSAADALDDGLAFLSSAAFSLSTCTPAFPTTTEDVWVTEMLRLLRHAGTGALSTLSVLPPVATATLQLASAAVIPGPLGTFSTHAQSQLRGRVWLSTATEQGLYECVSAVSQLAAGLNDVFFSSAAAADASLSAFSITLGARTLPLLQGDEAGWQTGAVGADGEPVHTLTLMVDNTVAALQVCSFAVLVQGQE
jgi:hypothetical protein